MEQKQNHPGAEAPTSLLAVQPEIPPHDPIMDDLYDVGPDKPLGYLPVVTIHNRGESPDAVAALSQERGLSAFFKDPSEDELRNGMMGELYVYDEQALADLLQQNTDILERYQWPVMPGEFVARVATEHADSKRQAALFKLIAWAFNDSRPEYARPQPGESLRVQTAASWLGRISAAVLRKR